MNILEDLGAISYYSGDFVVLDYLLENGLDLHFGADFLLRASCEDGNIGLVRRVLSSPVVDVNVAAGFPLRWSCSKGYLDIVKLLVGHPDIDIRIHDDMALGWCDEGPVKDYLLSVYRDRVWEI
jgi:hypothetical protein